MGRAISRFLRIGAFNPQAHADQLERTRQANARLYAETAERFGLDMSNPVDAAAAHAYLNSSWNWNSIQSGQLQFQNPARAGEGQFVVVMDAELDHPGIYAQAMRGDSSAVGFLQGVIDAANASEFRAQIPTLRQRSPERLAEVLPEIYVPPPTPDPNRRDPLPPPIPLPVDTRERRSRVDPYVRFDPTNFDRNITAQGLQTRFSADGRLWLTRYSDVRNVTRASDLDRMLYRQELWPQTAGKFRSGATLRMVENVPDAVFAGRTNTVNGVRQWYVTRNIPPQDLSVIKRLPGAP